MVIAATMELVFCLVAHAAAKIRAQVKDLSDLNFTS
jgi:hypothetical protein